jgi:hypothetical protein
LSGPAISGSRRRRSMYPATIAGLIRSPDRARF